jgi:hypothetical protein
MYQCDALRKLHQPGVAALLHDVPFRPTIARLIAMNEFKNFLPRTEWRQLRACQIQLPFPNFDGRFTAFRNSIKDGVFPSNVAQDKLRILKAMQPSPSIPSLPTGWEEGDFLQTHDPIRPVSYFMKNGPGQAAVSRTSGKLTIQSILSASGEARWR